MRVGVGVRARRSRNRRQRLRSPIAPCSIACAAASGCNSWSTDLGLAAARAASCVAFRSARRLSWRSAIREAGSLLARLPACLARHAKKLEREMHREQGAAPCQKQSRCSGFFLASDLVWCAPARNVSGVWLPRIWGSIQLFLSSSTRYEPSPTVYHVKYRLQDLTSRGLNAQAHGSLYSFYFSLVYTLHVYKAMYLCLVSGLGLGLGLGSGVAAPRIHLA